MAKDTAHPNETPRTPRWDWKGAGAWRASPARPCPICAGESNCQIASEGVVCCRRVVHLPDGMKLGEWRVESPENGAMYQAAQKHGVDGRDWIPIDPETGEPLKAVERSPEEVAKLERETAERREAIRQAVLAEHLRLLKSGGGLSEPVESYLRARGIDPAWLPAGKGPAQWLYFPDAPEWWPWVGKDKVEPSPMHAPRQRAGAIVAPVMAPWMAADSKVQFRGSHATYIVKRTDGEWMKRPEPEGANRPPRLWHGSCDGVVCLWGGPGREKGMYPGGLLLSGEGIDTSLAGQAAAGVVVAGGATAWASLSAGNLGKLLLPTEISAMAALEEPERRVFAASAPVGIHTWIVLGDLDKARTRKGEPSKTGQRKAAEVVLELRRKYPWITVVGRWPSSAHFPELVQRVEPGEDDAKGYFKGWVGRFWEAVGVPADGRGEDAPIDQERGCDWDDVLRVTKDPARLAAAIFDGLDLAANEERARVWLTNNRFEPEAVGDNASPGAAEPAGNEGGDGAGGTPPPGGGGGGKDTGAAGPAAEDDGDIVVDTELGRARQYLMECHAPGGPGAEGAKRRAGKCWEVLFIDGEWHRWDGVVYQPVRRKGELAAMRGGVQRWLTPKKVWASVKGGPGQASKRVKTPVNAGMTVCEGITKSLLDEVWVDTTELRFWRRPTFDRIGEPIFNRSAWQRWVREPQAEKLPEPRHLIALKNGVLNTQAMEAGELEMRPHSPLLFNTQVLPFDLPIGRVRQALKGGIDGLDRLSEELAPEFHTFLMNVFDPDGSDRQLPPGVRDVDGEHAVKTIECLQMLLWYYCTYDMSNKEGNIAIWYGPGNAGKGTLCEVFKAIVGKGNYATSTVDEASDKNHVTSWLGKRLVVVSEAEAGERADLKRAMNLWKRISGGDEVAVRELFKLERPAERLFVRILVTCNEMPDLRDPSGEILNRVIVYEFKRSHTGKESYDRSLKERIIQNELPGIFVGALAGAMRMGQRKAEKRKRVLDQPPVGATLLAEYGASVSEYFDFVGGKDASGRWTGWVEVTNQPTDVLALRDMWRAYLVCRAMDGDQHPERTRPEVFSKRVRSHLRNAGWMLDANPNKRMKDGETGIERQGVAFIGIKLSALALEALTTRTAAQQAKSMYGPSNADQAFNQPDLPL